jgi:prophage regulatory protein
MDVKSADLMGAHEIGQRLDGVSRQRVYQLTSRPDFPEPVADLAQGKIWLKADVEHWIRHRRQPGRRPVGTVLTSGVSRR